MFHNTQKIIYHKCNRIIINYTQFNNFYPQFIVSKKFFSSFHNDKHKTTVKHNNKEEFENLKKFVKIKNFEKAKIIFKLFYHTKIIAIIITTMNIAIIITIIKKLLFVY